MKPFKLGDKSRCKVQVSARLAIDKRPNTVETNSGAVYHKNLQHLQKTSEPPVEPITTKPEPKMASTDEKATTTTASTADQSSAPHKSHPKVVTVPNSVGGQSESGIRELFLRDCICNHPGYFLLNSLRYNLGIS